MRIIYPYNEILPKKKAHDLFIVQECAALANLGFNVTLLTGKGAKKETLLQHYQIPDLENLHFQMHFLLRKNNPLNVSFNLPFFFACQQTIKKLQPDYVLLSVVKQAAFHLSRKIPHVRYVYEVHELMSYPNKTQANDKFLLEKRMLERCDLIIVTTEALKKLLQEPPYALKVPIVVIPLAVFATKLPPLPPKAPLTLMYVGQLYEGQGLPTLLLALSKLSDVRLKIVGGTPKEILQLRHLAKELNISEAVEFLGFIPPSGLPPIVKEAHAFVAPFENTGRMPYVAHTKLFEYAEWGRPIIAPKLPIVEEHFDKGALLFEPGNANSLASCISALKQEPLRHKLQSEISSFSGKFSWQARARAYAKLLTLPECNAN